MKISKTIPGLVASVLMFFSGTAAVVAEEVKTQYGIIQDAEFQRLWQQKGKEWIAEDKEIEQKLEALRKKHGKRPNIIHIIWDDMKYGAIGHPMLNNVTGYKSPNINEIAANGMTFTRMYTEPSCTPTRVAVLTGRQPVRSGMIFPIFPIHRMGLPGSEVTIAEVLDDDYNTGFFEKSHIGDQEESYLHNQGFDEAIFTMYNQFAGQMFTPEAEGGYTIGWERDEWDRFAIDQEFRPYDWMWAIEGFEGKKGREIATPRTTAEYRDFNAMAYERVKQFIRKHAKDDKPFLLDWWPNLIEIDNPLDKTRKTPNGTFSSESFYRLDQKVGEIKAMLEELDIADNTLIVLMGDNGPMEALWPDTTYHNPGIFRGGKNDFLEGGVRVPAFAYWPGVIEPGTVVHDMVHAADLYTTFARLGGKMESIPRDRVIDGIDQTSLLLKGEGNGRRDHVFVYQGPMLSAVVKQQYKRHFAGAAPGLAGKGFFDLEKDPREEHPLMAEFLWAWPAFDQMRERHEAQIRKYPHTEVARGEPYTGVEPMKR